jgi:hypothetical protein
LAYTTLSQSNPLPFADSQYSQEDQPCRCSAPQLQIYHKLNPWIQSSEVLHQLGQPKTHNIMAWRVYTQFGFESKGLGVLWQLQFEHYVASREMGWHLHMKKRCFFHGLCNTWNTWHTPFVMCCHHNSKHFNIFSDIFWLSKIRFSVDLSSSWDSSVCQVSKNRITTLSLETCSFNENILGWCTKTRQKSCEIGIF